MTLIRIISSSEKKMPVMSAEIANLKGGGFVNGAVGEQTLVSSTIRVILTPFCSRATFPTQNVALSWHLAQSLKKLKLHATIRTLPDANQFFCAVVHRVR